MGLGVRLGHLLICLLVPLIFAGVLSHARIHRTSSGPPARSPSRTPSWRPTARPVTPSRSSRCATQPASPATWPATTRPPRQGAGQVQDGSPFAALLVYDRRSEEAEQVAPTRRLRRQVSTIVQHAFNHRRTAARAATSSTQAGAKARAARRPARSGFKPDMVVVQDCQSCHSKLKMRLGKTELIDTRLEQAPGVPAADHDLGRRRAGDLPADGADRRAAGEEQPHLPHRMHLDPLGGWPARRSTSARRAARRGPGMRLDATSATRRRASSRSRWRRTAAPATAWPTPASAGPCALSARRRREDHDAGRRREHGRF